MKDGCWYAAQMVQDFLGLKNGDKVFYRKLVFQVPLFVGDCLVVMRTDGQETTAIRLAQSLGVEAIARPYPNRVNPETAPEDVADWIESQYREWLKLHPLPKRHTRGTFRSMNQEVTL